MLRGPFGWLANGLALFAVSSPLYAGDCGVNRVDREPFSGEKPPPYEIVDDPCGTGR